MKRLTVLVPDRIHQIVGGSRSSRSAEIDLTPHAFVQALELVDYHDRYHFDLGAVTVVSIEDMPVRRRRPIRLRQGRGKARCC